MTGLVAHPTTATVERPMVIALTKEAEQAPARTKIIQYLFERELFGRARGDAPIFSDAERELLEAIALGNASLPDAHDGAVLALYMRVALLDRASLERFDS